LEGTNTEFQTAQGVIMNAASRMALDVARQDLADKMVRAEIHAQRREARLAARQSEPGHRVHRFLPRLRLVPGRV
jgi:hypothetical protein